MGCSSSKRVEASVDVYRPAPTSFAVFDIDKIQEPWVVVAETKGKAEEHKEKPNLAPKQILEKLSNSLGSEQQAPHSWEEVSKALEDLKPSLVQPNNCVSSASAPEPRNRNSPNKSYSFHTLEELDAKMKSKPASQLRKAGEGVIKPLKDNIFIVRDRLEREKEGKQANYERLMSMRADPLSQYPEKCPPGGDNSVVLYTTSLRGVRKTYEECNRVRAVLELHRVVFDERDVALHGGFLSELKEVLGEEGMVVPSVFVKGRYVGGAEQVVELNETGKLGKLLTQAKIERGIGRLGCQGCGGARFVPCFDCAGSCKVVVDGGGGGGGGHCKQRCPVCNENGLVHCPACL